MPAAPIRPFEAVPADQLDAATGGAFNWASLAQTVLQNVMGQIGQGGAAAPAASGGAPAAGAAPAGAAPAAPAGGMAGSPMGNILGSFMGMFGKAAGG